MAAMVAGQHAPVRTHYNDVIMTTMASQIISLAVVYSIVYSCADQRTHHSYASLPLVRGIHRDRWIPRTKGQLHGKCFHLMTSSWRYAVSSLFNGILKGLLTSKGHIRRIFWFAAKTTIWNIHSPLSWFKRVHNNAYAVTRYDSWNLRYTLVTTLWTFLNAYMPK